MDSLQSGNIWIKVTTHAAQKSLAVASTVWEIGEMKAGAGCCALHLWEECVHLRTLTALPCWAAHCNYFFFLLQHKRTPEPWTQRRNPPPTRACSSWTSAPTRPHLSPKVRGTPSSRRSRRTPTWLSSPWPSRRAGTRGWLWPGFTTSSSKSSRTLRGIKKAGKTASDTTFHLTNVSWRCPGRAERTGRATSGCWTPRLRTCSRRGTTGGGGGWGGPSDPRACLTWAGAPRSTPSISTCSPTWAPGVCPRADTRHPAACPPAPRWAPTARHPTSTTPPTPLTTATRPCWSPTTGVPTAEWPSRWARMEAPSPCRAATSSSPPTRGRRRRRSLTGSTCEILVCLCHWQPSLTQSSPVSSFQFGCHSCVR